MLIILLIKIFIFSLKSNINRDLIKNACFDQFEIDR